MAIWGLMLLGIGLLSTFFGYPIFKVVLVLFGLIAGAVLGSYLGSSLSEKNKNIATIIGAVLGAVLGGAIVITFYYIGVLLAGMAFGVILGLVLLGDRDRPLVLAILGMVFGILAVILQRQILILVTALGGAYLTLIGIAVLAGWQEFKLGEIAFMKFSWKNAPVHHFVLLAAWIILGLSGMLVQARITDRAGEDYRSTGNDWVRVVEKAPDRLGIQG
jgi:hypothetical protein